VPGIAKPAIQQTNTWFGKSWDMVDAFAIMGKIIPKIESLCDFLSADKQKGDKKKFRIRCARIYFQLIY